jgi:hypothetical protein
LSEIEVSPWKASFMRKWRREWTSLGEKILSYPEWMQEILLDDIQTAIKNRIAVVEMINQHAKRSR